MSMYMFNQFDRYPRMMTAIMAYNNADDVLNELYNPELLFNSKFIVPFIFILLIILMSGAFKKIIDNILNINHFIFN